jgi:hypothetical protein
MKIWGTKLYIVLAVVILTTLACGTQAAWTPAPTPYGQPSDADREQSDNFDEIEDPDESSFVLGLTYAATMEGLKAAVAGNAGTFVMSKGNFMAFFWEVGKYPAFTVMDITVEKPIEYFLTDLGGKGVKADLKGVSDLINYMKDTGWQSVPKGYIPKFVVDAIQSQPTWLAMMGTELLPTFILLPTWADPDEVIAEYYPEIKQ